METLDFTPVEAVDNKHKTMRFFPMVFRHKQCNNESERGRIKINT